MKVGKHGIIIEFTEPVTGIKRNATYLPEVPAHEGTIFDDTNFRLAYKSVSYGNISYGYFSFAGWTKIEAIDSLVRKAGYNGEITESVRRRIHLTRYQSTLFSMHYSEYLSYVKSTRGSVAPAINVTSKPAMALS